MGLDSLRTDEEKKLKRLEEEENEKKKRLKELVPSSVHSRLPGLSKSTEVNTRPLKTPSFVHPGAFNRAPQSPISKSVSSFSPVMTSLKDHSSVLSSTVVPSVKDLLHVSPSNLSPSNVSPMRIPHSNTSPSNISPSNIPPSNTSHSNHNPSTPSNDKQDDAESQEGYLSHFSLTRRETWYDSPFLDTYLKIQSVCELNVFY